ncbi:unnamed protein product [Hymenolepis diminuta]|uniref:Fungal_trans domain-containing protein n=1 Tax=Hymenolepis diminuta TaxID=6216 RepID=A0A0R3SLB5_HYMDI|nr:unnamed protein product [Hymenolepis diminuta]
MPFDFESQSILRQLLLGKSREEITQRNASQQDQTRWSESSSSRSSNSPLGNSNNEMSDVPNVPLFGDSSLHTDDTQSNSSAQEGYDESTSSTSSSPQPSDNSNEESNVEVSPANSPEGSMSHTGLMPFMTSDQPEWSGLNYMQEAAAPPNPFTGHQQFNQPSSSPYDQSLQGISSLATAFSAVAHSCPELNMTPDMYPGGKIPPKLEAAIYYCLAARLFYSDNK